jgi:hypothetical protein
VFADNEWWQVDLGSNRIVDVVRIDWTAAYSRSYLIQTSADGSTWTTAATETPVPVPYGDTLGVVETSFSARTARYVRIQSLERATFWGVSFWDAKVLGPSDVVVPAPDTTITSGPSGAIGVRDASFGFTSEPSATFECRLGATAAWQTCTSPRSFTGLPDGTYEFQVRASTAAGTDQSPATRTFTVDTAAPQTTIDAGPSGTITTNTAAFQFSSEAGATFACSLDGGAYTSCTSPRTLTNLSQGAHTFNVRATDAAGNTDQTPATRTFTVDTGRVDKAAGRPATASSVQFPTLEPDKAVDGNPSTRWGSLFADNEWWQVDLGSNRTVDAVRIDWTAAYPRSYLIQTSPDGTTWTTAATQNPVPVPYGDTLGVVETNFTARTARYVRIQSLERATFWGVSFWDVKVFGPADAPGDTTAPDTTITSGPTGTITTKTAAFQFASEAGATFACSVDGAAYTSCTSPRTLTDLSEGAHTFNVRASDAAGNTDQTPATRTFTVDTTAPQTTITSGPSGTVQPTTATFAFSSEAGATFSCSLDGGAYAACSSPRSLTGLSRTQHTFRVRATDAAGNTDATPAERIWTVQSYADNVRGTTGVFSYYRLGDSSTTAVDDRGQANGAYQNGPTAQASLIAGGDSSRDFDGVNDLVDFSPTPFGSPAAYSVEAWVRVDTAKPAGQFHFLVTDALSDFDDGFSLVVDSANRPVFTVAQSAVVKGSALGPALTLGQVAHVVGVYTGTEVRLYVNGTRRATVPYTGGTTWSAGRDLRLASQVKLASRTSRYLDGRMDEVALYKAALTDSQVASHNTAGR